MFTNEAFWLCSHATQFSRRAKPTWGGSPNFSTHTNVGLALAWKGQQPRMVWLTFAEIPSVEPLNVFLFCCLHSKRSFQHCCQFTEVRLRGYILHDNLKETNITHMLLLKNGAKNGTCQNCWLLYLHAYCTLVCFYLSRSHRLHLFSPPPPLNVLLPLRLKCECVCVRLHRVHL